MITEKAIQAQLQGEPCNSCATEAGIRRWKLLETERNNDGSCFIVECFKGSEDAERFENLDGSDGGSTSIVGYFDAASGNVYACDANALESPAVLDAALKCDPAVRFIGSTDGITGQLTVRQPEGNYLRICRWDRIAPSAQLNSTATIRTLPQCGCGGSLGAPKMFDTIVDMCAYHFCAFYL